MARFDKSNVKEITEYFESIGYPIIFFNSNDETSESFENSQGYRRLRYLSPITIRGVKRNDEWNIFHTNEVGNHRYFEASFKVQNGKITLEDRYKEYFKLELVGSKSEPSPRTISCPNWK